jgi:tetratricopeptide (TPR) repeat protein
MKKRFTTLAITFLFCSCGVYGQSFKEVFKEALKAGDLKAAERILKDWDLADANDAEIYVSYFNFYTLKSQQGVAQGRADEDAQKALEYISEGIERFPTRFDMRIGKLYMLVRQKDYATVVGDLIRLIEYSKKIGNNWKGEDFRLIEKPDEMLYGAVQEFQEILFEERAEGDEQLLDAIRRISEEMIRHYPAQVQGWINLSTVYAIRKEYDRSLEALSKAEQIEPGNAILLYNIACVYRLRGERESAAKYFALAIKNATGDADDALKAAAQRQLDSLK